MNKLSISTKLILTLVLIMGIGSAASSFLSIRSQTQLVLDRDLQAEIVSTNADAENVTYFIEQVASDIRLFSSDLSVEYGQSEQQQEKHLQTLAENLLHIKPYILEIHLISNAGNEEFGLTHVHDQMELVDTSDYSSWKLGRFDRIFEQLVDEEVYVSTLRGEEIARIREIEEVSGPTMVFATPVFVEGDRSGTVVAIVSGNELLSIVREAEKAGASDVYLVDESGFVVAGPDTPRTPSFTALVPGSNLYEVFPEQAASYLGGDESLLMNDGAIVTRAQIINRSGEDSDVFTVLHVTSEGNLFLPVNQLRSQLIISNLAQFAFVALALYILSGTFVRPLRQLRDASQKIAKGRFDERVQIKGDDEVAELGRSFNKMAERLQDFTAELETRVDTKTDELAAKLQELEDSNRRLNEIKQAILNVMEDVEIARNTAEQEKARVEAYINSIGEGVLAIDKSGKIMLLNKSGEKILGKTFAETYDMVANKVVSTIGKDAKGNLQSLAQPPIMTALKTAEPITMEYYVNNGTKRIPVVSTAAPILLNEEVIGAVEVMRDVTTEKQIDLAKSEFVSMVSHQLRTPITTINWYIEMVSQNLAENAAEEDKEYLHEIKDASTRMLELINSLLDVSRIELGTLPIAPKPTDIKELSESCLKELQHEIDSKKLQVSTDYQEDIPEINVDPKLMRMIFTNLLTNAVKYTDEEGSVAVKMYTEGDLASREGDLVYEVKDTGIGIPDDQQERIFEKMFRADNVKDTDVNGTGLGLYIIKSMLERMKGSIWFESELGKGSTFYVKLPLKGMPNVIGSGAAVS